MLHVYAYVYMHIIATDVIVISHPVPVAAEANNITMSPEPGVYAARIFMYVTEYI